MSARSRNQRLGAIRSFFRYVAFKAPEHSGLVQQILAIPSKRYDQKLVDFLTREEIEAILQKPDRNTWIGRRDHALILVAVGEACANSIEHGYGPAGGSLELSLARSDRYLEATIRDYGRWREPRGTHRGRGIGMMRRLTSSVDVVRRPDGTEVRLGWNLGPRPGACVSRAGV